MSEQATFNKQTEPYSDKSKHVAPRHSQVVDGHLVQKYIGGKREKAMRDVWEISYLNSQAKERTGYPTQKPLAVLERIIKASSDEGGIVFDPFCDCATACIAAEKLGRQWAGIDISAKAADLIQLRMERELGLFYQGSHRTDIPRRTDIGKVLRYNDAKNSRYLYSEQGGYCNGCKHHYQLRNLTVDHIVPRVPKAEPTTSAICNCCAAIAIPQRATNHRNT